MAPLLSMIWLVVFVFSIMLLFHFIGIARLTDMFPEGRRWWHIWAQLSAIAFYTIIVLINPWKF
jgi:hypothetical protein